VRLKQSACVVDIIGVRHGSENHKKGEPDFQQNSHFQQDNLAPFFGSFGVCRAHVCRKYANRRAPKQIDAGFQPPVRFGRRVSSMSSETVPSLRTPIFSRFCAV
jgi:hypothetical protein